MIVRNLNLATVAVFPVEADSPLLVHANAVLTFAIAAQLFQSIPRRHSQVLGRLCRVQYQKLRKARCCKGRGIFFTGSRRKSRSVSLSPKLRIISAHRNAVR